MNASVWLVLVRVCILVALAASASLLVDYTSFNPSFCTAGSGCAEVRASGYGYLSGVPVPVLGLVGYGVLYMVTLVASGLRERYLLPIAALGGALALGFLLLQALVIGKFCFLCVVVDVAGMLAAGCALMWKKALGSNTSPPELLHPTAWTLLAVIALAAPLSWPKLRPQPAVHPGILAYYQPGKINVVEFADFQCPFCRLLHPRIKELAKAYGDKVNIVQLNMPLERHPQALDAARAAVCAKAQGKGSEMVDELFAAEELGPAQNRRLAVTLELDLDAFDACLADPKTTDGIKQEAQLLRDAGFQGLPTTYIGATRIVGAQDDEVFQEAFERAERGEGNEGVPGWAFLSSLVLAAGGALIWGRRAVTARAPAQREDGTSPND